MTQEDLYCNDDEGSIIAQGTCGHCVPGPNFLGCCNNCSEEVAVIHEVDYWWIIFLSTVLAWLTNVCSTRAQSWDAKQVHVLDLFWLVDGIYYWGFELKFHLQSLVIRICELEMNCCVVNIRGFGYFIQNIDRIMERIRWQTATCMFCMESYTFLTYCQRDKLQITQCSCFSWRLHFSFLPTFSCGFWSVQTYQKISLLQE